MSSVVDLLTELVREASVAAGYGDVELALELPATLVAAIFQPPMRPVSAGHRACTA